MTGLAAKIERFLDKTEELLGDEYANHRPDDCPNSMDAVFKAASAVDLPAWTLDAVARFNCSCGVSLQKEIFTHYLTKLCTDEQDRDSLNHLLQVWDREDLESATESE